MTWCFLKWQVIWLVISLKLLSAYVKWLVSSYERECGLQCVASIWLDSTSSHIGWYLYKSIWVNMTLMFLKMTSHIDSSSHIENQVILIRIDSSSQIDSYIRACVLWSINQRRNLRDTTKSCQQVFMNWYESICYAVYATLHAHQRHEIYIRVTWHVCIHVQRTNATGVCVYVYHYVMPVLFSQSTPRHMWVLSYERLFARRTHVEFFRLRDTMHMRTYTHLHTWHMRVAFSYVRHIPLCDKDTGRVLSYVWHNVNMYIRHTCTPGICLCL